MASPVPVAHSNRGIFIIYGLCAQCQPIAATAVPLPTQIKLYKIAKLVEQIVNI